MKRWVFSQIHKRNLIYNQCWEDPSVDKQALNIAPDDRIVTITSAGCNALDYLLSGPAQIDCVDLNAHQTALLDLKLAAIRSLHYDDFFEMFGTGRIPGHKDIYNRMLRPLLSDLSRRIWDKRIDYFAPEGRGLYFHGTSGLFARALNAYIDRKKGLREDLDFIQTLGDLERQARFYQSCIAPRLWSPAIRWVLRRQLAMSLLGVPTDQVRQIRNTGPRDISSFVEERVGRVFTRIPLAGNYFWRVYINGSYTRDCCPEYLRRENFEVLRARCDRIRLHTMSLTDFLGSSSNTYSIFVLLDHMDWLTSRPEILSAEWAAILKSAHPGARIIYRSGGSSFDRLPAFALERIVFRKEITEPLHELDRVGTYGSFYLASLRA